ncbi:MAG: bifunctional DNA-binding transcriptional regulator/O6-methylguanine-DNA methyltransferase Ada [Acidobacteriota bacterium]
MPTTIQSKTAPANIPLTGNPQRPSTPDVPVPWTDASTREEAAMLNPEMCWDAISRRDREHDGRFVFGVVTTGIFCRPSCPARRPRRENVRFYETTSGAEQDGLRACRRCLPTDPVEDQRVEQIRRLCAYIREHCDSGDPLTLEVLGRRVGLSPARLRRLFREIVGVTPRQYVEACRFETLEAGLRRGDSVTDAIYDAGFGSSSRVYEQTGERLGMTPGEYKDGGRGLAVSYVLADTRVGRLILAATDRGICFVHFGETDEALIAALRTDLPKASIEPSHGDGSEQLDRWLAALDRHLAGSQPHLDLPLDVRATAFRLQVWTYLRTIPRGETRSYAEVAHGIGRPEAVRAVANACGANRTAILIPCHRVIRSNGDLGGYRWGIERKRALLAAEQA